MARVSELIFLHAPWLLLISAIAVLFTYLSNRKFIASHIYLAVSSPGVILTLSYFLNARLDLGFESLIAPFVLGFIFLPAIWIFPLVSVVAARQIYLQKMGRRPVPSISLLSIAGSAALVILYVLTAVMTEGFRGL
jgi:hypothetical protein